MQTYQVVSEIPKDDFFIPAVGVRRYDVVTTAAAKYQYSRTAHSRETGH